MPRDEDGEHSSKTVQRLEEYLGLEPGQVRQRRTGASYTTQLACIMGIGIIFKIAATALSVWHGFSVQKLVKIAEDCDESIHLALAPLERTAYDVFLGGLSMAGISLMEFQNSDTSIAALFRNPASEALATLVRDIRLEQVPASLLQRATEIGYLWDSSGQLESTHFEYESPGLAAIFANKESLSHALAQCVKQGMLLQAGDAYAPVTDRTMRHGSMTSFDGFNILCHACTMSMHCTPPSRKLVASLSSGFTKWIEELHRRTDVPNRVFCRAVEAACTLAARGFSQEGRAMFEFATARRSWELPDYLTKSYILAQSRSLRLSQRLEASDRLLETALSMHAIEATVRDRCIMEQLIVSQCENAIIRPDLPKATTLLKRLIAKAGPHQAYKLAPMENHTLRQCLFLDARLMQYSGEYAGAEEALRVLAQNCKSSQYTTEQAAGRSAQRHLAEIYCEQGKADEALELLNSISTCQELSSTIKTRVRACELDVHILRGDAQKASRLAQELCLALEQGPAARNPTAERDHVQALMGYACARSMIASEGTSALWNRAAEQICEYQSFEDHGWLRRIALEARALEELSESRKRLMEIIESVKVCTMAPSNFITGFSTYKLSALRKLAEMEIEMLTYTLRSLKAHSVLFAGAGSAI